MPGIFGIVRNKDNEEVGCVLDNIIASANKNGKFIIDKYADERRSVGMGRVSLGVLNRIVQPLKDPKRDILLIFHGELYGNNGGLSDPEYVLRKYCELGDRCAAELSGIFHFAVYDMRCGKIKLFSDKFGLQPLYYAIAEDGIIFGGEVKYLAGMNNFDKSPDFRSFADFFSFGHILGDKTLFEGIKLIPPGSVLTFDPGDGSCEVAKYWFLEKEFVEKGNYDTNASVDGVVTLLEKAIRKRSSQKEILGLSLSGGLDSRGIIAGLGKDAAGLYTTTLGQSGCADELIAQRIADLANCTHEFMALDENYLVDFAENADEMIRLSDGMYHPVESTEMLALEYFRRAPFKILLRGHGGEIAKAFTAYPVTINEDVNRYRSGAEVLSHIFSISKSLMRDIDPGVVFNSPYDEIIRDMPRVSLRESCESVSESFSAVDVCMYYYLNEYVRRDVVSSLEIFRNEVDIRMPYLDEDFIKGVLSLPLKNRCDGEVHVRLIEKNMPDMLKIPNSNTGAPLDAGPVRLFLTDKINTILRKVGVRGYRHYTEYGKWYRNVFRKRTQDVIFSERAMSRNIYNMDGLKRVFDMHSSGVKDYSRFLATVLGLELWFRKFVD